MAPLIAPTQYNTVIIVHVVCSNVSSVNVGFIHLGGDTCKYEICQKNEGIHVTDLNYNLYLHVLGCGHTVICMPPEHLDLRTT